jgi:RNA polymerase sigma-70 factor (ECF subfamily)
MHSAQLTFGRLLGPMTSGPAVSPGEQAGPAAAPEPARLRELMAAAQAGNAEAYRVLLTECVPLIRRLARLGGADTNSIDDVVQDSLMTIHRARHTFDPARPFTPWLRAIVQRRSIDMRRRSGRQASRELHAPLAYDSHPDPAASAEQQVTQQARAARLAEAVALLPPGQRQALEQLGLQERSLKDVSAHTGRSAGALKVNLHRALKSLRMILGPDEP